VECFHGIDRHKAYSTISVLNREGGMISRLAPFLTHKPFSTATQPDHFLDATKMVLRVEF